MFQWYMDMHQFVAPILLNFIAIRISFDLKIKRNVMYESVFWEEEHAAS